VEPYWPQLVRRAMPLPDLPPALVGRTLLQLSDLHVGPLVDPAYLIETLREAAALRPDYVALTGDLVTYRTAREYDELARVLAHLPHGRSGTVGTLGNHDYGLGWRELDVADRVTAVARDAGVDVLRNATREVGGLQFVGVGDLWSPEFDPGAAVRDAEPRRPTVVLCHNPDAQDLPVWDGVRGWVLAGHTHGGQCRPPFPPPPILPVRNRLYTAGAFDVGGGRTLYVNRGLGFTLPVRFNVRPELTLFTLQAAPDLG
jgi:predicted MPP superfamily phosphohydrolase